MTLAIEPEKRFYYGWWVLAVCCYMFMVGGIMTYASTIYFPAMMQEMGWKSADLALVFAIMLFSGILWSPVAGWLTDKLGCRNSLLLGCSIFMLSGILLSTVHEIWQVIGYWSLLTGFGQSIVLGVTVQALLRRWFVKRAGLAVSIMFVCSAFFQAMMFPMLNRLSVENGFSPILITVTLVTQVVAILLILFIIKDTPEKMGLNMDGMSVEEKNRFLATLDGEVMSEKNNTLGQAIKMKQFWLWIFIYGLCAGVLMGIMGNVTTMGMSFGFPAATVGTVMTFFMLSSVIGRLGAGWLGDKYGKRKVLICTTALTSLILLGGYLWVSTPEEMIVFMLVLGFFIMAPVVLMMPWVGDLWGRINMGRIMGVIVSIATVIIASLSYLAGKVNEATGSFSPYLGICAGAMLLVVILLFFLTPTETLKNNMEHRK